MAEKISVVIPAYNAEKFIKRALMSVINQTYKELEIIVVDDGSTDNTLLICKNMAEIDKRVIVYHKKNEGVTKARDYGISKATGDYLTFIDSDDTIEQNMYEILYNNLKDYDADISHCGYKVIKPNNEINYFYNSQTIKVQNHNDGIIDLITGKLIGPGLWTKLFKKSLFEDIEYDKSMRINEDYVINLLVFKKAKKSVFCDYPLYNYYQNENSGSTKNTKEYYYKDILNAADLTENIFRNNDIIYPYAQRKWFKTYSDMYKNQASYPINEMEFDIKSMLREVLKKLKKNYVSLINNTQFSVSDKFILKTLKYCPKLLLLICRIR